MRNTQPDQQSDHLPRPGDAPDASATIYTLLLFVILYLNRDNVWRAFQALLPSSPPEKKPVAERARIVAFALVAMALLFAFDQLLVNFFGHGKG